MTLEAMMIRYMIIETYLLVRLVMAAAQHLVVQVLLEILRHLLHHVHGVRSAVLTSCFFGLVVFIMGIGS